MDQTLAEKLSGKRNLADRKVVGQMEDAIRTS